MSGREPSSVRAASVRSSMRRTAVVTEAPVEAAWAAKDWSFWRLTWARQSAAVRPARATKTASRSHAIHVLAPLVLIAVRCIVGTDPGSRRDGRALYRSVVEVRRGRGRGR